ncbi:peptidoglycan DD-metalloendopeptidase family protein [candidate division KSB1 bacterium]|nr:peptidoglycan DD-metalloendopeptidase family protein [candidate division KSB1 bacterium]
MNTFNHFFTLFVILTASLNIHCNAASPPHQLLRTVVDLNSGETVNVELNDHTKVSVCLLDMGEKRFPPTDAIADSWVKIRVDNDTLTLHSARYNLPKSIGNVQIDCPVTRFIYTDSNRESWALKKDARLRLWPKGSPWITPATFVFPIEQKLFASQTQMSNEQVHVDGGSYPQNQIYYHNALDFGGAEGLDRIVAATDGLVVSAGDSVLPGYENTPVEPRYDVVYIQDERGWLYRYSHMWAFHLALKPGTRIKMGQYLGVLGKEGGSGGWSHLHFGIHSLQPSGEWGTEEGYAYIWQAYQQQYKPALVAVARPHIYAHVGEQVMLNGNKSWAFAGINEYGWQLSDGNQSTGAKCTITYTKPGQYSEILKITDNNGNSEYDAATVTVFDTTLAPAQQIPPTVHAVYYPSLRILPGDPVTFLVRSFDTPKGNETINFGDGSEPVTVYCQTGYNGNVRQFLGLDRSLLKDDHHLQGYAKTVHKYTEPGIYTVTVRHTGKNAYTATTFLFVKVKGGKE